jgi:hypothetical protein
MKLNIFYKLFFFAILASALYFVHPLFGLFGGFFYINWVFMSYSAQIFGENNYFFAFIAYAIAAYVQYVLFYLIYVCFCFLKSVVISFIRRKK